MGKKGRGYIIELFLNDSNERVIVSLSNNGICNLNLIAHSVDSINLAISRDDVNHLVGQFHTCYDSCIELVQYFWICYFGWGILVYHMIYATT